MTVTRPPSPAEPMRRGRGPGRRPVRQAGSLPAGTLPAVLCLVAGLACTVAAWILAVPPFGSYDEFDHAFRASGVAHGQLVAPPSRATRGTGALVRASPDVVAAARAECLAMPYTHPLDCSDTPDGVPSGAGRYSPVYYAGFGWVGLLVPGQDGLVVQRVLSALACLVLFGAAAGLVLRWPDPGLGLRALVVAASPMLLFSLALFAPNGLEMAAGTAWWAGLLTLWRLGTCSRSALWVCAVSGALLATLRALGPLWLGTVAVIVLILATSGRPARSARPAGPAGAGLRRLAAALRPARAQLTVVLVALLAAAAWTLSQGTLVIGKDPLVQGRDAAAGWRYATLTAPLKLIQLVTALPGRGSPPPPAVLAGWVVAFGLLVVPAVVRAHRRARRAWFLLLAAVVLLPLAIEASTYQSFGGAWQGRYVLPLAVGVPLLAAAIRSGRPGPRPRALIDVVAVVLATAVAHAVALWTTVEFYAGHSPTYRSGTWPLLPGAALVALVLLGGVLAGAGLTLAEPRDARPR